MRKILLPVAAAVLILSSVAATPAHACCAEDVEKLERRIWIVPDNSQLQLGVESMMAVAKEHLEKGREKKCNKIVQKMDKVLKSHDF